MVRHHQSKNLLTELIAHLVERPSLLSGGYDLLWGQDEPVEAGVSQLNTEKKNEGYTLIKSDVPVHIWDVGNTKGPVEGGARSSVEDAWDAASLTLENVKI